MVVTRPFSRFTHSTLIFSIISTLILSFIASSAAGVRPVHASNLITVNTFSDDQTASTGTCVQTGAICLRNAIATAVGNSSATTINFNASGTTTLKLTSLTVNNGASNPITIDGTGKSIIIDGGSVNTSTGVGVFAMSAGSNLTLNTLTVQNGNNRNTDGGGVYNNFGTLTILNSTFSNNIAPSYTSGGAVANEHGLVTITNSIFSGNSAANGYGGAIYNTGSMTITGSTLSSNSSVAGGGIQNDSGGIVTITGSIISGNSTYSGGSGIDNTGSGSTINLAITNSTVSNNISNHGIGGGLYTYGGQVTIANSTFSGNTALNNNGGGGAFIQNGTVVITNSTFSGNSASNGGGLSNYEGTLTVSNDTFSGNTAPTGSGGAISAGFFTTIANSTISGNSAGINGGGIDDETNNAAILSTLIAGNTLSGFGGTGPDLYVPGAGSANSLGYNLIGDGTHSFFTNGVNNDQVGTTATPINAMLGALANNGGPTKTLAEPAGSFEIANGDCAGHAANGNIPAAPAVTTDQRGIQRKNPAATGLGCDVGAFELPNTFTPSIYRTGTFYIRFSNTTGYANLSVNFTSGTKPYPIVDDWTGIGYGTVGVYDQNSAGFLLCTQNSTSACALPANQIGLTLGNPNDTPLSGRWATGLSHAGAGVYRPTNGILYLKKLLTTGYADNAMVMGIPGDDGVAGDWTGKGFDSPGIYRPNVTGFFLSNQVTNGVVYADISFTYGTPVDMPVAGDWIAQGHFGVGMFRPTNGFLYLHNTLTTGYADNSFYYGQAGDIASPEVFGNPRFGGLPPPASAHRTPPSILIPNGSNAQPASNSVPGSNRIGD